MISGIDISAWQGKFDLAKAQSEGFEFVIVKAGGSDCGRYIDERFADNYAMAKALGMPVGVYWFARVTSVNEAVADADYLHEHCLKDRQFELPIYLDVEGDMLKLPRRELTDICKAWCGRLEELGYFAGIYSGLVAFRDNMYDDELQGYAHWLAQWSTAPDYTGDCLGMWQYGGEVNLLRSNKVAGQVCDQDYMLVDYPGIIKASGRNGFPKPVTPEPVAPEGVQEPETGNVFYRVELGGYDDKAKAVALAARIKELGIGEPHVVTVALPAKEGGPVGGNKPVHGVGKPHHLTQCNR